MSEVAERVKAIIVDKLSVEETEVTNEASFTNDLGADSLDTVELIMEFEKEFNIAIPDDQAENNKQRIRRQKFYQRNDFLHSGYYSVEKGGEKFDFLTYQGRKIDPDEYPKIMHECLGLFQRFILPVKMIADGNKSNDQHS